MDAPLLFPFAAELLRQFKNIICHFVMSAGLTPAVSIAKNGILQHHVRPDATTQYTGLE